MNIAQLTEQLAALSAKHGSGIEVLGWLIADQAAKPLDKLTVTKAEEGTTRDGHHVATLHLESE